MEAIQKRRNEEIRPEGTGVRQSNFELLRILCMVAIVAHHFSVHGGFDLPVNPITVNGLWIKLLACVGKLGVNIFVLISGYFMVSKTELKFSRVAKLWLRIAFYSLSIYFGLVLLGREPLGLKAVIAAFLPVFSSSWWFASCYFVMFILSPFMNVLLRALDRESYQKLLILTGIMWCVVPTLTGNLYGSNALIWFLFLYAVAGYIRLWQVDVKASAWKCLLFAGAMFVAALLLVLGFKCLGVRIGYFGRNASRFYKMYSLPIVLAALGIFMGFKKLKIPYNRHINAIASLTFGVYLIHDSHYIRHRLWKGIFRNARFAESGLLIPYTIAAVAIVFVACATVEWMRAALLERRCAKWLERCDAFVERKKEAFFRALNQNID